MPEEIHGMNILDWGVIALYVIFILGAGFLTGAMVNVLLFLRQWWWQVISISWLRWNLTGFMSTVIMARVLSEWDKQPGKEVPLEPGRINWPVVYGLVGFYFILIGGLAGLVQKLGQ